MAGRVLSRRALRDEHDQAERAEPADEPTEIDEPSDDGAGVKRPRARKAARPAAAKPPKEPKPPAKPRVRKKAVKVPPRMFARWAVCDGGLKRVAVFEYKDRVGADAKLAQLQEQKKGPFFLQLVKDPYEPPAEEAVPAV